MFHRVSPNFNLIQIVVAHATIPLTDGGFEGTGELGGAEKEADNMSVLSGQSDRSKTTSQLEAAAKLPWYRGVTCKDVKDIMPTLLILLAGVLIMIFIIPYAFESVITQLKNVAEMDRIQELNEERAKNATIEARRAAAEAAEAAANSTMSTMT